MVIPDYGPPIMRDGIRYCPNCDKPLTDLGTKTQWAPRRLYRCMSGVDPETQEPLDLSGYEWVGDVVRTSNE